MYGYSLNCINICDNFKKICKKTALSKKPLTLLPTLLQKGDLGGYVCKAGGYIGG